METETYEQRRDREHAEKQQRLADQDSIFTHIADELNAAGIHGIGWRWERVYEHCGNLLATMGNRPFSLHVWFDNHKPTAEISYSVPRNPDGSYSSLGDLGLIKYNAKDESRIQLTYTKATTKVFSDIIKRSLPAAIAYHYAVNKRHDEKQEQLNKAKAVNARLLEILAQLGQSCEDRFDDRRQHATYYLSDLEGSPITSMTVSVNCYGSVDIDRVRLADGIESLAALLGAKS